MSDEKYRIAEIFNSIELSIRENCSGLRKRGNTIYWNDGDFNYGYRIRISNYRGVSYMVTPSYIFEDQAITRTLAEIFGRKLGPVQYITYEVRLARLIKEDDGYGSYDKGRWLFADGVDYENKSSTIAEALTLFQPKFKKIYGSRSAIKDWDNFMANDNIDIKLKKAIHFSLENDRDGMKEMYDLISYVEKPKFVAVTEFLKSNGIS